MEYFTIDENNKVTFNDGTEIAGEDISGLILTPLDDSVSEIIVEKKDKSTYSFKVENTEDIVNDAMLELMRVIKVDG